PQTNVDRMKLQFFESGLYSIYYDAGSAIDTILEKVKNIQVDPDSGKLDPIEKIYMIFISGLERDIVDLSFARLLNEKARNYYRSFVRSIHVLTLKEHINSTVKYFYKNISETRNNIFYIGSSYGELAR